MTRNCSLMTAPNTVAFAETLLRLARNDRRIIALATDSRGSASLDGFAQELPGQFVELGIAEQNLVGVSAGMATCGKIPFACSPACFLSMRGIEQIKVDVAYSRTNVKLIGISGGVSYGALGSSHHSVQDLAVMRALPDITVVVPSDNLETHRLTELAAECEGPVYMRLGRNPVPLVHESDPGFEIGKGVTLRRGTDVAIIATGELVRAALDAAAILRDRAMEAWVIELHTIKPLDEDLVIEAAVETGAVVTVEEHSVHGGLGGAVAELLAGKHPTRVRILGIPDEVPLNGSQQDLFTRFGLTAAGIARSAEELINGRRIDC